MAAPKTQSGYQARAAVVADGAAISALIQPFAEQDLMLPRSVGAVYESIRDFQVVYDGDELVGCAALHVWDDTLAEVKSLAVASSAQGSGLGSRLIEGCVAEARRLGLKRVFALVLRVGVFARLGFREVAKEDLPQKVWGECIFCPKYHRCDEVAMVLDLAA